MRPFRSKTLKSHDFFLTSELFGFRVLILILIGNKLGLVRQHKATIGEIRYVWLFYAFILYSGIPKPSLSELGV